MGLAQRAINHEVIAITNCYRTKVGKAFYLALQRPTPRVTEKPSQQPIQNCLAASSCYSIKSYVLEAVVIKQSVLQNLQRETPRVTEVYWATS